jgi:flagellin
MSGTLNSINTNTGAMIALEALDSTNSQLNSVQKQISTGYRVSDATDDGAAYAVAQSVRSSVGALTTANQQLGGVQGLLSTTGSALNDVSNLMASMRDVLVNLASSAVSGNERTQYESQYQSLLANVKSDVQDASYNGQTLIGNITGSTGNFNNIAVVRNEVGSTYGIATFGGSTVYTSIAFTSTQLNGTSTVAALITATGTFINQSNSVSSAMNTYGSATNYVGNQVSYNNDKISALNTGLGSLVDADLAQESALLQSLQIKQQLGTQSLTLADQTPQVLLSLVKAASSNRGGQDARPASRAACWQGEKGLMSNLVLELRSGEVMIVNGAPIRFRTKSRIELTAKARFLFGKQIMQPDQADSPARRIYFALQSAYIGTDGEREQGLIAARDLVGEFKGATTSALAREILDEALAAAEADDCYRALKLARRIIRHEDVVLGRVAPIATPPQQEPPDVCRP